MAGHRGVMEYGDGEARARGGYLGVELAGHMGTAVHHFQCVVGRQLDALLPVSNGFEAARDIPKVLPLLVLGEEFDEEQPGGPLRGSTRFTVNLNGVSIAEKEVHAQLKIYPELPLFMKGNFNNTGELFPHHRTSGAVSARECFSSQLSAY